MTPTPAGPRSTTSTSPTMPSPTVRVASHVGGSRSAIRRRPCSSMTVSAIRPFLMRQNSLILETGRGKRRRRLPCLWDSLDFGAPPGRHRVPHPSPRSQAWTRRCRALPGPPRRSAPCGLLSPAHQGGHSHNGRLLLSVDSSAPGLTRPFSRRLRRSAGGGRGPPPRPAGLWQPCRCGDPQSWRPP